VQWVVDREQELPPEIAREAREVEVKKEHKRQIEEILGGMQCPKDFQCYKSGFKRLCKATDVGIASFLRCLDKEPQSCRFSSSFGHWYLCNCPLRIYLVRKLSK
jgi:hypothetical protein